MTDVSIVVPTWRRPEALNRCLDAVHEHTEGDYELLVLDNGSRPRGWTWAANRGLRMVETTVAVLLNDDCIVQPGWLPPLVKALEEDPTLWAVSSTDPVNGNWPLNLWSVAVNMKDYGGGHERWMPVGTYFSETWIHWQSDCDYIERAAGHFRRVEESLVIHDRFPTPTDEALLAVMREWWAHDYGEWPHQF